MIKTKRIETTRLAQLGERRSAEQEAVGSNPGRTNTALRDKVKRDDPNESSAVYLLTSDDKYAVCGTNFSPNQLLCRKFLATFLPYEGDF